jgi:biotin transport system substrate-specific component
MRKVNSKLVAVDLAECAIFVALMVAGTYIQIPFPLVPLTFQTVFAVLAGLLLGWKKGAIALTVYMIMGLIGIPVFSGGGGIYYVVKPSFGYIIGFIFAAAVSGMFYTKQKKLWQYIVLALGGFLVDYIFGITYFIAVWQLTGKADLGKYVVSYNLVYMPKDIALCILAAVLAWRVLPIISKTHLKLATSKEEASQSKNQE